MFRLLTFFLLLCVEFFASQELPQTFSTLAHPLYNAHKHFEKISFLKEETKTYVKKLEEAKKVGFALDADKNKELSKKYLSHLRKLQKDYDVILHYIHKKIYISIEEKNYKGFISLTQYPLDGLLQSTALYNKSLNFYKEHRQKKRIAFFENKIQRVKAEALYTHEYVELPEHEEYNSKTQNTSKKVRLQATDKGSYIAIYVKNLNPYSITLHVRSKLKNFQSKALEKVSFTLVSNEEKEYMRLYKQKGKFDFRYSFSYSWIIGSIGAVHDDTYIYRLPFAKAKSVQVSQGYNGKYTHKGRSRYAIDFAMSIGTKIFAAREGLVVKLKEDSSKGGVGREFAKYGNYVTLEHKDGTFATYYHLHKNGVIPKVGMRVKKGDFLGYSGNTGYSSGPHLHFAVFKASSATRTQTIPIKLLTTKGIIESPKSGVFYTAK